MVDSAPLYVPVVLGTAREGRRSEKAARFLVQLLEARGDLTTGLVDVRDIDLPPHGPGGGDPPVAWQRTAKRADGFVIVTPEYNRGFPGALKSLLDSLYDEYAHKAVGLCGVSAGPFGGARAILGLLPTLRELGLVAIRHDFYVPDARNAFDDSGAPNDAGVKRRAQRFADELVWMTRALRNARVTDSD